MPSFHKLKLLTIAHEAGDTSARDIARRTGLDGGQVNRILNGRRQPSFLTAARIADAYAVPLDDLVDRADAA